MLKRLEIDGKTRFAVVFESGETLSEILDYKEKLLTLCSLAAAYAEPPTKDEVLLPFIYPALRLMEFMRVSENEMWAAERAANEGQLLKWQPQPCTVFTLENVESK